MLRVRRRLFLWGDKKWFSYYTFRNTNACILRARWFLAYPHRFIFSTVWHREIHPRLSELVSQDTRGAASVSVFIFWTSRLQLEGGINQPKQWWSSTML
jgi:hypothetical protein